MIVDGKAIALQILAEVTARVKKLPQAPRLTVFTCAPNFETQKFLALKQQRATEVGIEVTVVELDPRSMTPLVIQAINEATPHTDGIVVQLPFPPSIDIAAVLASVPVSHDVDALMYDGSDVTVLPPVVGAIDAIARHHQVLWTNKQVVVVGQGRLVGAPAALYAASNGAHVTILEKDTADSEQAIKEADILILGAGVPGLVAKDMVKPGVIVFDAGTSEEGGMLVGDADTDIQSVASLVTPVPGGIGPITIAVLLQNVVTLAQNKALL
ncbi:bifunctional 5,10-methylenetetrahydrofolate dehydrogenase/5,10-methenyltetrahydrofolate cyclohydrolase [Patescibacteria group bacterium]|nr:bifunctional 5,10-methylenetetrahydrofolate dehydrogenase/5,10-methenyltetrahydrofolate cyclohydrolase [Patescibacteria group bacterium]